MITRRSTSGLVMLLGQHCIDTSSTVHEPSGRSSGESEFYARVKRTGTAFLGLRPLFEDWGLDVGLALGLCADSSAAQGFASRRRVGRQRHVSTRFLWLQDQASRGEF